MTAIAVHSCDAEWLKRQNAHDLAILYGVLSDKNLRMLASLQHSNMSDATIREGYDEES